MILKSDSFFSDDRVKKAKALILEALRDHQRNLIFSPSSKQDLTKLYHKKLTEFGHLRGGDLWYPYLSSGFGKGALVELLDGSVKYDFISGIGAHFGHSLPLVMNASLDAALQDTVMQGHLQQGDTSRKLLDLLCNVSGLDHGVLTTSGVMANENALKIIFQKKFPASRVLAFEKCFMGRTLSVSQITDKCAYRDGLPATMHVDYLPFLDADHPEESTADCISILKKLLHRYPGQYAVMCFELIQGERGYYPGTTTFFKAIMDVLKKHDIAILVDEIQTFGRTESLFAFQTFGVDDYVDVVTVGKLAQVCATLYRSSFKPRPGLISQTFTASTSAIESAYVIISSLMKDGYLGEHGKIKTLSHYFREKLISLSHRYPDIVTGPFGYAGMLAMTVFGGDKQRSIEFSKMLFEHGVMCFIAGDAPTRIRFLLPMGDLQYGDIDSAFDCIQSTLEGIS